MPTDREQRRLLIFREYSANLTLWRPELERQYACPLCLQTEFTEDAVVGPEPALTEEHCIPRGLGRNLYTLTCAECNSAAGRLLDHHFHKRLSFEAFWAGTLDASITAQVEVYGKKLAVSVTRRAGPTPKMELHILAKNCNPKDVAYVQNLMQEGKLFEAMNMQIGSKHVPSIKRFRIAVLKAGYLLMFRHFGYGYVLNPALNDVRSQVSDVRSSAVPLDAIVIRVRAEALPPAISEVTAPTGVRGFAVPIPVEKYGVGLIVILPSDPKTYERWAKLKEEIANEESLQLNYHALPFDRSLLTERRFSWNPAPDNVGELPDTPPTV